MEAIQSVADEVVVEKSMKEVLSLLDDDQLGTLKRVVELFGNVVKHADSNQMNRNRGEWS